jgi:hypothetical protein
MAMASTRLPRSSTSSRRLSTPATSAGVRLSFCSADSAVPSAATSSRRGASASSRLATALTSVATPGTAPAASPTSPSREAEVVQALLEGGEALLHAVEPLERRPAGRSLLDALPEVGKRGVEGALQVLGTHHGPGRRRLEPLQAVAERDHDRVAAAAHVAGRWPAPGRARRRRPGPAQLLERPGAAGQVGQAVAQVAQHDEAVVQAGDLALQGRQRVGEGRQRAERGADPVERGALRGDVGAERPEPHGERLGAGAAGGGLLGRGGDLLVERARDGVDALLDAAGRAAQLAGERPEVARELLDPVTGGDTAQLVGDGRHLQPQVAEDGGGLPLLGHLLLHGSRQQRLHALGHRTAGRA